MSTLLEALILGTLTILKFHNGSDDILQFKIDFAKLLFKLSKKYTIKQLTSKDSFC